MNGNISKRKGLVSSVDTDSLNYISEKVSEKLTGYTAAVALEEAARTEADKALESDISKKQDKLTFDTAPTAESENPVTSGGIKDELDKKVDKADGKVLSSNDFTDEDKAKLDKKVDKADGMGLSKIKDISLEKMTIASSPGGVLAKCEMLDIETQSGEKILASYVPETHLMEFGHPNKCVTKSKLSDELQAEMDKISTKADKSDTYTKDEIDSKISGVYRICGSKEAYLINNLFADNECHEGDVYNVVGSGGTINGIGISFPSGATVKWTGDSEVYYSGGDIPFDIGWTIGIDSFAYTIISVNDGVLGLDSTVLTTDASTVKGDFLPIDSITSAEFEVSVGDNVVFTSTGWDKLAATVDLSSYVKNTDYADSVKGGVVKISHPGTSYLSMYEGSLSVDVSEILSQYKIEQIIVGDSAPTTSTFISKAGSISEGLLYFDKTNKNAYILTQVGHGDEPNTYVYEWKKIILEDNLSDYVKNTDYANGATGGIVKVSPNLGIDTTYNVLYIVSATSSEIGERSSATKPIVCANLNTAVKAALSDEKRISDMTDTEKANARGVIGAISETDYGTTQKAGVVKSSGSFGFGINTGGYGYLMKATNAEIDAGADNYKPIVPSNLNHAVRSVSYFDLKTSVTDNTLLLSHREETRLTNADTAALTLTMPDSIPEDYESAFSFKSGATATTLTYSSTPIIWKGADCDSDGDFIPMPNTIYEVGIKYIGNNSEGSPIIVARVGVC